MKNYQTRPSPQGSPHDGQGDRTVVTQPTVKSESAEIQTPASLTSAQLGFARFLGESISLCWGREQDVSGS